MSIPERIRGFLWLSIQDKLLTNVIRFKSHLTCNTSCSICVAPSESLLHIFRDCPSICTLWSHLLRIHISPDFFLLPLGMWLVRGLRSNSICELTAGPWNMMFATLLWLSWKRRNAFVFSGIKEDSSTLLHHSKHWAHLYNDSSSSRPHLSPFVCWEPPPSDWVYLTIDGVVSQVSGRDSIGGIFHDSMSSFLSWYFKKVDFVDAPQAELWAILVGVRISWNLDFDYVLIQSDSVEAITLLSHPHQYSPHVIIHSIRSSLLSLTEYAFTHICCEVNVGADFLSKYDAPHDGSLLTFSAPPPGLSPILDRDISGAPTSVLGDLNVMV
ncbi:hypothetical protein GQ457_13G009080 [Hibiscus cannabinus]